MYVSLKKWFLVRVNKKKTESLGFFSKLLTSTPTNRLTTVKVFKTGLRICQELYTKKLLYFLP